MEGVEILNTEEILGFAECVYIILAIAIIVFVLSLIIVCISAFNSWNGLLGFSIVTLILSWILILAFKSIDETKPTGRYRYEATIDESVSITEVYNHYKVIERRGDIWVLEDKEEE